MRMISLLIALIIAATLSASAEDNVYNFYFQKAPGPAIGTQTELEAQPISAENRWTFLAGYVEQKSDFEYTGYGLGLMYELNKYFEVSGGLVWTQLDEEYQMYTDDGYNYYRRPDYESFDISLGVLFSPIRVTTNDYDVFNMGVEFGALTSRSSNNQIFRGFGGLTACLNFSKNMGVLVSQKFSITKSDEGIPQNFTQLQASLAIKF